MDARIKEKIEAFKRTNNYKRAYTLLKKEKILDIEGHLLAADCLYHIENYPLAIFHASEVIKTTGNLKQVAGMQLFIGVCYRSQGNLLNAIEAFEASVKAEPSILNAEAYENLLYLYLITKNIVKFESLSPKLLSWEGYYLKTHIMRIESANLQQNTILMLERVQAILPYAEQLSLNDLATISGHLIGLGKLELLNKLLTLSGKSDEPNLIGLKIKLLQHQKKYKKANALLDDSTLSTLSNPALFYMKSNLLDKLKQYDLAANYLEVGEKLKLKQTPKEKRHQSDLSEYLKLYKHKKFKRLLDDSKHFEFDVLPFKLAFIIGFPRSGTTLLDNVLDTQDNTLVFSETDIFNEVKRAFKQRYKKVWPQGTLTLTKAEIQFLRTEYVSVIRRLGFDLTKYASVIEKNPHFTKDIGFLSVIFPEAKFVYMQRHPFDACISSYQQDFVVNSNNYPLISLTSCAKAYKETNELIATCLSNFAFPVLKIRYENLVTQFEEQCESIFNFLGITMAQDVSNFHNLAREKVVTSASSGQTDQPIYLSSINRWKNYKGFSNYLINELSEVSMKLGYSVEREKH